nr:MAG TPA: Pandonodin peptide [Caudoviricetes sp.]DAV89114.1 MAG TPA: Pandonodin peptide [Caudoviricetes sp.]
MLGLARRAVLPSAFLPICTHTLGTISPKTF